MNAGMSSLPTELLSVEAYLEGEQQGDIRHEYLAGQIVAMVGASRAHALLCGALHALLLPAARRQGCQLFMADMKVRIDEGLDSYFYYPDLVLSCHAEDRHPFYVSQPVLIVEVLSPSTERIDSREKLLAYRLLPSLREYLMLRQDRAQADLYQRDEHGQWQHLRISGLDGVLSLCSLDGLTVSLREIHADLPASSGQP